MFRRRPKLLAPVLRETAGRFRKEAQALRRLALLFPDHARALYQAADDAEEAANTLTALAASVRPPPRRRGMEYWR
jgi:hypothetical protein